MTVSLGAAVRPPGPRELRGRGQQQRHVNSHNARWLGARNAKAASTWSSASKSWTSGMRCRRSFSAVFCCWAYASHSGFHEACHKTAGGSAQSPTHTAVSASFCSAALPGNNLALLTIDLSSVHRTSSATYANHPYTSHRHCATAMALLSTGPAQRPWPSYGSWLRLLRASLLRGCARLCSVPLYRVGRHAGSGGATRAGLLAA